MSVVLLFARTKLRQDASFQNLSECPPSHVEEFYVSPWYKSWDRRNHKDPQMWLTKKVRVCVRVCVRMHAY